MNVLFLTIGRIENVDEASIYLDLLRTFRDNGHSVYCVSPNERREGKDTSTPRKREYTCFAFVSVISEDAILSKRASPPSLSNRNTVRRSRNILAT